MLHIPPTNCLLLTAKQEPYKKAFLLTKNVEEFSRKSLEERACRQKKIRQSNRTRQKNKRGNRNVESNDSPEIPDRGETSDIPCLHMGGVVANQSEILNLPIKILLKMVTKHTSNCMQKNLYHSSKLKKRFSSLGC